MRSRSTAERDTDEVIWWEAVRFVGDCDEPLEVERVEWMGVLMLLPNAFAAPRLEAGLVNVLGVRGLDLMLFVVLGRSGKGLARLPQDCPGSSREIGLRLGKGVSRYVSPHTRNGT